MSSKNEESFAAEGSFAAMFEAESQPKRARVPRVGDRIEGVVVHIGADSVFVELDGKRQAFFEAVELRAPDGTISVKEGDKVAAQVIEVDEARGVVRLGRSFGKASNVAALEQAKAAGLAVDGKVTGVNKGGLEIDLGGARAFCPLSQVDVRRVETPELTALIGQTVRVLVTDIRDGGKNVVVSRKAILKQEGSEGGAIPGAPAVEQPKVGAIVTGVVDRIEQYGLFVQLDGIKGRAGRGLLPVSEIGVPRGTDLKKKFPEGTKVTAKVLEVGEGKLRLSIKGAHDDAERADYEAVKDKKAAPTSLGTFADLFKQRK
mgnify:CR=1 FL=1